MIKRIPRALSAASPWLIVTFVALAMGQFITTVHANQISSCERTHEHRDIPNALAWDAAAAARKEAYEKSHDPIDFKSYHTYQSSAASFHALAKQDCHKLNPISKLFHS